jgi:hypothetical protein
MSKRLEIKSYDTTKGGQKMRTYGKLREKIKAIYGTIGAFADAMGKDRSSISNKLNGLSPWKSADIEKACSLLDIAIEEVSEYFFY